MDRKSIESFHVRQVTLVGKSAPITLSICNSSKKIETPRFMKFNERSSPYSLPLRAKYIIKPETFEVAQTHDPGQLLEDYSTYTVLARVALLYHYRFPFFHDSSRKRVKDNQMIRYLPELIDHIEQQIC